MRKEKLWKLKNIIRNKKIMTGLAAILIVGGVLGGILVYKSKSAHAMLSDVTAQTTTAQIGDISNTVTGTGNLELDAAQDVDIPSSLVIDQVMVSSGDHVSAGDVLATVDAASVLGALQEIQSTISELDQKINKQKNDTIDDTIATQVSGRIKKIYAASGESVADTMIKNGSLLLLSVDGKMSVTLTDVSGIATGNSVNVTLSDGTAESGTVESVSGGVCVVTMPDDSAPYGDSVTVSTEGGTQLGTGVLEIHQMLSVTGTAGTISGVKVSENEHVAEGKVLLSLTDVPSTAEYQELLAKRAAMTETLQVLLKLSQTNAITADMDGTVQDIYVTANSSAAASSGSTSSGSASVSGMKTAAASSESMLTLLSYSQVQNGMAGTLLEEVAENKGAEEESVKLSIQIQSSTQSAEDSLVIAAPVTDGQPQMQIAAGGGYTGTISWNPADNAFHASGVYQANVVLTASEGFSFGVDSIEGIEIGAVSGITVGEAGKTLSFSVTFPKTAAKEDREEKEESEDQNEYSGNKDTRDGNKSTSGTEEQSGDSSSLSSNQEGGVTATLTGTSSDNTAASSDSSSGSESSNITAFTISPDENMILSVNVDELDINSIALGQEAAVTFDALEGESYTGEVTSIGSSASVSGGVAKYVVQVTISRDDQMKEGMNASAVITIESREGIVTIPVNALQERGSTVFVYTTQDEKGNLGGEAEVTTGLSDGSNVEITEGLSEGDTVYYLKAGSSENSSGMGQMPDMGGMEMPSQGGGSGDGPSDGGGSMGGFGGK